MTIYGGRKIADKDMTMIASYMQDDIREEIHAEKAPCTNEEFLEAYLEKDPAFQDLLETEFDFVW